MKSLANIFSSAAKFEILGLLCQRSSPLPLRHIAYLTGLPIRSTEMAVENLCKEEIVHRKKSGKLVLHIFNVHHPLAPLLQELFSVVKRHLAPAQQDLDKKAQTLLAFIDSTNTLFRHAKPQ